MGILTGVLFMWGPAIAALLLRRRFGVSWQELGVVKHGIRWKWMGMAVLLAMAWPVITLFYNWLLGDLLGLRGFGHTEISPAMMTSSVQGLLARSGQAPGQVQATTELLSGIPLPGGAILLLLLLAGALAGSTVNLVAAMGEELGWRGMLLHLTLRRGLGAHVLFTGVAWGLWHAPLILQGHNYPAHPVAGVFFMCLFTTALALPMAWVRIRSRCVWAAGLMHGTVNGVAGTVMLFNSGSAEFLGGAMGIASVLALLSIGAGLFIFDPHFRGDFATP